MTSMKRSVQWKFDRVVSLELDEQTKDFEAAGHPNMLRAYQQTLSRYNDTLSIAHPRTRTAN